MDPGNVVARNPQSVRVLALVLTVGALARFGLAGVNPPNNAYDNHLEPVAHYAFELERPAPHECWQCYQPPVYYSLSAVVLTAVYGTTGDSDAAWEAVQWISALASVGTLILTLMILRLYLPERPLAQAGGLTLLAILPRALYTASSTGNDALLVFFTTAAVYFFARLHRDDQPMFAVAGLGVAAVLAAWTKQSGLVVLALVAFAAVRVSRQRTTASASGWILCALVLVCVLAVADEVWRTYTTGVPLASNQHFEPRAWSEGQFPGHVSWSTFVSFLPGRLLEHPTLDPSTVDSFWTQLFARTWFDFEPRFLPVSASTEWLAKVLYVTGLFVTIIVAAGAVRLFHSGPASARKLLLVPLGFVGATFLQTLRFPYFSSMKALFILPAVSVGSLCFAFGIDSLRTRPLARRTLVGGLCLLLLVGLVHWATAVSLNGEALGIPTAPQWPVPPLGPPGGP